MAKLTKPSSVKVVPKDGEIEITININISVDSLMSGEGLTIQSSPTVKSVPKYDDDKVDLMIPDFASGFKVDFGK